MPPFKKGLIAYHRSNYEGNIFIPSSTLKKFIKRNLSEINNIRKVACVTILREGKDETGK